MPATSRPGTAGTMIDSDFLSLRGSPAPESDRPWTSASRPGTARSSPAPSPRPAWGSPALRGAAPPGERGKSSRAGTPLGPRTRMRGPYVDESLFNTTGRVSTPGSPFGAGRGAVAKPQTTRASPALSSRGRAPSAGGDPRNESPRQPWRPSSRTGSIASPRTIGRKYETKLRKGGAKAEVDETLFVSKRMTPQESHVMAYTASEIRGPTTLDGVDLSIKAKEIPARPKAKPSDRIIDGFCNLPGGKANNPARFSATKTLEGGVGDGIAAARPSNPSINQRPVGKQLLQHTAHHRPRAPKTASAPASTGIFTHANNEFHMSSKPVTKLQNNIYAHMPDV